MRVAVVVAALMLMFAGSAQAAVAVWEGFEDRPELRWTGQYTENARFGFESGTGTAHSGQNNAYVSADNGWVEMWTRMRVGGWEFLPYCHLEVRAKPERENTGNLRFEIYNASTGGLISSDSVAVGPPGAYRTIQTQQANLNGVQEIKVKLIFSNGPYSGRQVIRLDDLVQDCVLSRWP